MCMGSPGPSVINGGYRDPTKKFNSGHTPKTNFWNFFHKSFDDLKARPLKKSEVTSTLKIPKMLPPPFEKGEEPLP